MGLLVELIHHSSHESIWRLFLFTERFFNWWLWILANKIDETKFNFNSGDWE